MEACDEKATHPIGAASIAVLLLIVMPVASQAPQAEKTFSGTLTKVDPDKKVISVKGTGNQPEMTFMYDDTTQVTGAEKSVQGLAGKSGAMLKVTYREEGPERIVGIHVSCSEKIRRQRTSSGRWREELTVIR
jgi:hypothetical protein